MNVQQNNRFPVRLLQNPEELEVWGDRRKSFEGTPQAGKNEMGPFLGAVKECFTRVSGEWEPPKPPSPLAGGFSLPNLELTIEDLDDQPNLNARIVKGENGEGQLLVTNPGPDGGRSLEVDLGPVEKAVDLPSESLSIIEVRREGNLGEETVEITLGDDTYFLADGRLSSS